MASTIPLNSGDKLHPRPPAEVSAHWWSPGDGTGCPESWRSSAFPICFTFRLMNHCTDFLSSNRFCLKRLHFSVAAPHIFYVCTWRKHSFRNLMRVTGRRWLTVTFCCCLWENHLFWAAEGISLSLGNVNMCALALSPSAAWRPISRQPYYIRHAHWVWVIWRARTQGNNY